MEKQNEKPNIVIDPVVFSKPQLDSFAELFDSPREATRGIAQQLALEIDQDYPGYFDYEKLRDGTSPLFDLDEVNSIFSPAERALSDEDIIKLLAVDTEGNPIEEGTLLQGLQRGVVPLAGASAGFYAGAKSGFAAQQPIPPAGPIPIVIKAAIPIVTGITGAVLGEAVTSEAQDVILGEEKPILPEHRVNYEMGKTLAGGLAFLPLPFMVGKNVQFGAAQYLDNLATMRNKRLNEIGLTEKQIKQNLGPLTPEARKELLKEVSDPRSTRFVRGIETLLSNTRDLSRNRTKTFLSAELAAIGGQTIAAGTAEQYFPGETGPRLTAELIGGSLPTTLINPILNLYDKFKPVASDIIKTYRQGGLQAVTNPLKIRRQTQAVEQIIDLLEAEGENVDEIIKKLSSTEFDDILVDESGKPLQLTAGTKTASPILIAVEASLEQLGSSLTSEKKAAVGQASKALRNVIMALAQTGDPQALQLSAELAKDIFDASLTERLAGATDNVLQAFTRVQGDDPESNLALSERLYDVITQQMKLGRDKERQLWKAVEDFNVYGASPEEMPSFISTFTSNLPKTDEARNIVKNKLGPLYNFVARKQQELYGEAPETVTFTPQESLAKGIDALDVDKATKAKLKKIGLEKLKAFEGESVEDQFRFLGNVLNNEADALLNPMKDGVPLERTTDMETLGNAMRNIKLERSFTPPMPEITGEVSSTELIEMRSVALNLQRELLAAGDSNSARIAGQFAESILDDLNRVEGEMGEAYQVARAYSRAFNDTFTRAFAGDVTQSTRTGADRVPPELIAKRLMTGGNDPTYVRIKQIDEIGNFAKEQGLEGAEEVANTISGVNLQILRNASANAFDQNTGEVSMPRLQRWMKQNEDLLNQFPALKEDLQDAEKANLLLNQQRLDNKAEEAGLKGQVTFQDLLGDTTESPTTAIARSLSRGNKKPIQSLNNLFKVVDDAPEDLRESAMSGLKRSIFEYAAEAAGGNSSTFSPRTMYEKMFTPISGSENKITLTDWMLSKGVATEPEVNQMKKFLTEMIKLEVAHSSGDIADMVEKTGPILDFYLRVVGSSIGTASSQVVGGGSGSSLVAAGAGSRALRNIFESMPAGMKTDVMTELMQNPQLLAAMMRRPRTTREKERLNLAVGNIFLDLGFLPVRRVTPGVIRESMEEEFQMPSEIEQEGPAAQFLPQQAQPSPMPAPAPTTEQAPVQQPPVPPIAQTTPMSTQPVDRARFASMFPGDTASDIIRSQQGIGSLMG